MFFPCSLSQNPLLLASPGKLPNFISVLLFSLFLYFYSRLRTIVSLKTPFFLSFLHSHSLFGRFLDTWLMKGYWIFAVQPEPIITFFFFLFFWHLSKLTLVESHFHTLYRAWTSIFSWSILSHNFCFCFFFFCCLNGHFVLPVGKCSAVLGW